MKRYEYYVSEADNKKTIFFPETLKIYKIDNNAYEYLKKANENNEYEMLPEKLKKFVIENNKEKEEIKTECKIDIRSLTFNITQTCNMKCIYCFGDEGTYKNEGVMDFETIKITLEKVYGNNFENKFINFFGGEPLLNFELIKKTVEYVNKFPTKPDFGINTNATLITNEIADFLKENNFSVCVSLDGEEEIHNIQRPLKTEENSFKKTIEGIKILEEKKIPISVRATMTNLNVPEDRNNKINSNIEFFPVSTGKEYLIPTLEKYEIFLKDRYSKYIENKNVSVLPRLVTAFYASMKKKIKNRVFCRPGISSLDISIDGNIYYCHRFGGDDEFYLGNIYENSMKDIEEKIEIIFQKYHNRLENEEKCSDCWARYICGGGCIHENLTSENFDNIDKEIFCNIKKRNIEYVFAILAEER